jgi:serine/threonine protein kinase
VAGGGVRARPAGVRAAWPGSGGRLARGRVMAVTGSRVLAGRYVLLDVLGTGGMATVWRARDEVLGREVAVKVLSPQYAADPGSWPGSSGRPGTRPGSATRGW